MDRQEDGRSNMDPSDSYDTRQSKQRASVKWLLSKAFNNRVPENLREPYYRDHEEQEYLKPPIVGMLANAELYCMALSNMYSDPNYNNLNHWNILQTLARKGVHVKDPTDCAMTETVLIQTNPLKMSAHICVMEGLMVLYGREVGTRERIAAAVRRWGGSLSNPGLGGPGVLPHEESLLSWVASACLALKHQTSDMDGNLMPTLPVVESLRDLCDGVALAALISLYCPDVLPPSQIRAPRLASVHDSIHNLTLVQTFCQRHLPYNVFHMMPEDITYMRGSMHQNLLVMLADLFNMLEIHPAKCVRFPSSQSDNGGVGSSNMHGVVHKRCLPPAPSTPIPDLRSGLHTPPPMGAYHQPFTVTRSPSASHMTRGRSSMGANISNQRSACSTPERRSSSPQQSPFAQNDESFVVHRGKAVPTLSSVVRHDGYEHVAAGRPSNWEEQRRSSYAGRRSRRGSVSGSDDSQLTVENFGGSQDRLNFIGRNPEKELATVTSANVSSPRLQGHIEQNVAVRSSIQDARGSIELFYNDNCTSNYNSNNRIENEQRERSYIDRQYSKPEDADRVMDNHQYQTFNRQYSKPEEAERIMESQFRTMTRQQSNDVLMNHDRNPSGDGNYYLNNNNKDSVDGETIQTKMSSFADLTKFKSNGDQSAIQLVYMQHGKEEIPNKRNTAEKKMMSFSTMPSNTTTWQQQSLQNEQHQSNGDQSQDISQMNNGHLMAAQINNIRMKLEEKRRRIEHEKKRMELAFNRQRQQLGQQAFLQAVSKNKGSLKSGPSGDGSEALGEGRDKDRHTESAAPERPVSLQDISSEAQSVENKWMNQDGLPFVETRRTPDLDGMGIEEYQQSIAKMNSSLQDIQTDIARLTNQQHQIQSNPLLQQQVYQPQQPSIHPNQYGSQHNVNAAIYGLQHNNFGSSPHIPQDHQVLSSRGQVEPPSQFYLHQQQQQPTPPPRRTWAQQAQVHNMDNTEQRYWQSPNNMQYTHQPPYQENTQKTWAQPTGASPIDIKKNWNNSQGFVLHDNSNKSFSIHGTPPRYQNGSEAGSHSNINYNISSPHSQPLHLAVQSLFNQHTSPSSSPQHRANTPPQRQHSLGDLSHTHAPSTVSLQQLSAPTTAPHQVPVPAPTIDDMEPQNISFIGNAEDEALHQGISRLNITSGKSTYRIPSPTRPSLTRNSFQQPAIESNNSPSNNSMDRSDNLNEKGFYISFGGEQPKRPKPPLRTKRGSPKKDRTPSSNQSPERESHSEDLWLEKPMQAEIEAPIVQRHHPVDNIGPIIHRDTKPQIQTPRVIHSAEKEAPAAIIIGNQVPNAETAEEMERKKERIILLSLQRRQAAEEARARSESAAEARRQKELALAEEKAARKEQQAQRREQILHQYKLKKAIEEAEREGKVIDKSELMAALSIKPTPPQPAKSSGTMSGGAKLRAKVSGGAGAGPRARPKTIHVDSGAVQMAEGMLLASRGKQGSSTNLTAGYNPPPPQMTMRRDYYRGSQDSLADRAGLYRDSPIDESRGMSPGSGGSVLGRRGSYKTSRENVNAMESQSQTRGRSKYSTYQNNFKTGRKSSSLMNLCDSGLGRATPPRRAPSPGLRALPSPSGPGSLPPGLVTKRRTFDDGSSDISSTPSSIMDYSGPRLYKQPATKSNRGIMLNAVEYCVFPGAVNKEAKRRVLEEINNSESKHFLVLFRDAGCQFRALYSYCPETDLVTKLYGTGPKQVNDRMFDKFFKYNSGSKCFSQIHTKHLTVTIDAFTIHNSLWQGKKVQLPNKKDMALVI